MFDRVDRNRESLRIPDPGMIIAEYWKEEFPLQEIRQISYTWTSLPKDEKNPWASISVLVYDNEEGHQGLKQLHFGWNLLRDGKYVSTYGDYEYDSNTDVFFWSVPWNDDGYLLWKWDEERTRLISGEMICIRDDDGDGNCSACAHGETNPPCQKVVWNYER